MASSIDWYFDFVSPYSYIGLHRLNELPVGVTYKPVLFAGLLNHWGQKGPAEIPAKRKWTYRSCVWEAHKRGIALRFPALHPFNPLQHLRLALAAGCTADVIRTIFDFVWTTGEDACDPVRFSALCTELDVDPARHPEVKDRLRANTEEAAARSVFGVPSLVIDGEVFWGADSMAFAQDFLRDRRVLDNEETRRLDTLPSGAARGR